MKHQQKIDTSKLILDAASKEAQHKQTVGLKALDHLSKRELTAQQAIHQQENAKKSKKETK